MPLILSSADGTSGDAEWIDSSSLGGGVEPVTNYLDTAPVALVDAATNNICIQAIAGGITASITLPPVASSPKVDYRIFLLDPNFTSEITLAPSVGDSIVGYDLLSEGDKTVHLIHDGVSTWYVFYSVTL